MHWSILWEYRAELLDGLVMTLLLSAVSIAGSFVLGTGVGCLGQMRRGPVRRVVQVYVELLRNLPIVAEFFILYFALGLDALPAAILGLTLHQSAYIADVIGAGFRAVPAEQTEAGLSAGLSPLQIALHITLPQVLRLVMPPLTSQFIEVVKNSAIVMMIGLPELTFATQDVASETFRGFEASSAATVAYIAIALAISGGMGWLGRRRLA